ncbi:hypothetical protein MIPYR_20261 [uncultured Microbacterium sp.]|uniref:Uncharacterized protein n=1 Tax=uncultured Microbacterium sp. TaxID=191216 RepID=A0A1Y5P7F1_9MICO|nr:hypothetical protein MIPYR_20261 [uncultured Microbacterium sp.]
MVPAIDSRDPYGRYGAIVVPSEGSGTECLFGSIRQGATRVDRAELKAPPKPSAIGNGSISVPGQDRLRRGGSNAWIGWPAALPTTWILFDVVSYEQACRPRVRRCSRPGLSRADRLLRLRHAAGREALGPCKCRSILGAKPEQLPNGTNRRPLLGGVPARILGMRVGRTCANGTGQPAS